MNGRTEHAIQKEITLGTDQTYKSQIYENHSKFQ